MADLLHTPPAPRARLRALLAGRDPVVAPGAYDALSARLVEQAGFDVVYMTGFGSTASLLGRPDVGLLTGTEMVDNARRIVAAVGVPVVADADTGYGNAVNVVRTVQAYAQAGADLLFVEAPTGEDDVARVATELRGVAPLVFNWAEGGRTPALPLPRIAELGFRLVLFPIGTLLAATAGIRALLATLRADGTPAAALPGLPTFDGFTDLMGLPEIRSLEERFGAP